MSLDAYHAEQARLERSRLHFRRAGEQALCLSTAGRFTADARDLAGKRACVQCRQLLEQAQRSRPDPVLGEAYPVPRATSALDERSALVLERSIAGEAYERSYAWRSVELAISTLVAFRHEGTPVRSSSSPTRFDPDRIRVAGDHGRHVSALPDRLLGVDRAVERAYTIVRVFAPSADEDGQAQPAVRVAVAVQREALLLSIAGGRAAGGGYNFSAAPPSRVAEMLEARHGVLLTDRQVSIVVREGKRAVAQQLRAIGELGPARQRGTAHDPEWFVQEGGQAMAVTILGCDVHGWEAIAEVVELGESTCRRLAERVEDPLPTYTMLDVRAVGAKREELAAWRARQVVARRVGG